MSHSTSRHDTANQVVISLAAGLFAVVAIIVALTALGLPRMEAAVFAILSGFTLGAFVYRERSLMNSLKDFRNEKNDQFVRYEKQIEYYYSRSLVCLASFDAGSLLVDRASPGFLQLLRIPPNLNVRGKSIVELLRVNSSSIETLVRESRQSTYVQRPHELKVQDADGNPLSLEVTLDYIKDQHIVEAAFLPAPGISTEAADEADISDKDLDRFRRGMYRRETRIIELKEEINEILKGAGKAPRYGFDLKAKGSLFSSDKFSENGEGL